MAETQIIIHDVHVHHETGHVTYTLNAKTTHASGAITEVKKQYGIDAQALRDRFNDDISQFENWISQEHRKFSGADPVFVQKLLERKGTVIG